MESYIKSRRASQVFGMVCAGLLFASCDSSQADLPENVLKKQFADPPNEYRIIQYGEPTPRRLETIKQYGIGGCLAFFYNELRDPAHPKYQNPARIGPMLDAAKEDGIQIWLADDYGYPSGMAGGKVVEETPGYEVRSLVRFVVDGTGRKPAFFEIPEDVERIVSAVLYPVVRGTLDIAHGQMIPVSATRQVRVEGIEGRWKLAVFAVKIRQRNSQAQSTMGQFSHSGRYPDLMNRVAMKRFIELSHARLAEAAGEGFSSKVKGFYTNEPNLMQLHWDQNAPGLYAGLPWNRNLLQRFRQMHRYDLLPVLDALYEGEEMEHRRIRMHFHQTVADLLTESFALQIRDWCAARGVLSSGHFLLNEYLSMHVASYGDLMKFVSGFDIPALDIGIPNPDRIESFPYQQIKFFSSVAAWKKRGEVICLLDPIISGGGLRRLSPDLPLVLNSANMAFLHGANQMSAYFPLEPKETETTKANGYTPEVYRALNEYIGRISLLLRGARRETSVALYYPIAMFQADYKPSNLFWNRVVPLYRERQQAWEQTEHALLDGGLDYTIIHPEALAQATLRKGNLEIGSGSYRYLVMPQVEILPKAVLDKIKQFEAGGGTVLWVGEKPVMGAYAHEDVAVRQGVSDVEVIGVGKLAERIEHPYGAVFCLRLEFGESPVSIARFQKGGQCIYYLVNRSAENVQVQVDSEEIVSAEQYDPVTGEVTRLNLPSQVNMKPFRSLLVVHEKEKTICGD